MNEGGGASAGRTLLSVGLAVILGAGAGAIVNLATGETGPAAAARPASEPERVQVGPHTTARPLADLAGTIEVVETGLTATSRPYCASSADQDPSDGCYGCSVAEGCRTRPAEIEHLVSFGVIVRNGSDHLLKQIPLTLTFLDGGGRPTAPPPPDPQEIQRLLPGETLGLGAVVDVEREGTVAMTVVVGAPLMALDVGYAAATADVTGLYEATASRVAVEATGRLDRTGQPQQWTVRFDVEGSLPEDVTSGHEQRRLLAAPQVIYRGPDGRVVGGDHGSLIEVRTAPLSREASVHNFASLLPDSELTEIEVHFTDFQVH